MKLTYIANARIPTEKAHGYQICKMCEEFSFINNANDTNSYANDANKIEVELVLPKRRNYIKENLFKYYDIKENFKIKKLPSLDLVGIIPRIGFWIQNLSFSVSLLIYLILKKQDIIYSRDLISCWILSKFKKNLVYEIHSIPNNFSLYKKTFQKFKAIVTINQYLKDALVERGIDRGKIFVAHDGVDLKKFKVQTSKLKAKEKTRLPTDKKIVLYAGHLYGWKGADILAKTSDYLDEKYLLVFVGGTEKDIEEFKNDFGDRKNILILGQKPHSEIPFYLKSADVLILPNSSKENISKYWTSPLKMFEYMTAERPIVASDLPSIREILNEDNAVLVEPDSSQKLAQAIDKTLKNQQLCEKIAKQASKDVQKYSWKKRAKKILEFIYEK